MLRSLMKIGFERIKGVEYPISENVTNLFLINFFLGRTFSLLVGMIRLRSRVFLGRNVSLKAKGSLHIAPFVSIGDYCYLNGLSENGIIIGTGSSLGRYGKIQATATLVQIGKGINIGRYVGIGENFYFGAFGGISIGDETIIGERLTIHSDNHNFDDLSSTIRTQGTIAAPVEIGKNCWIGSNVTILGGVKIADGCVIGAGSVVTKSMSENAIIVGNPATAIKVRGI